MHKRLVLIDGNPLMYRAYHSPGTRHLQTSDGRLSGGFYGTLKIFLTLQKRLSLSHYVVCFDTGRSWRNDACPTYKAHGEALKPNGFHGQLSDVQAFLRLVGVPVYMEPQLEADDLISVFSYAWLGSGNAHSVVIVSSDRDYFQLVGQRTMLYDDRAKKFFGPSEVEAEMGVPLRDVLTYRCLVGDKSDLLKGVPGYGPKRARGFCADQTASLTEAESTAFRYNKQLMQLPRSALELGVEHSERKRLNHETTRLVTRLRKGLSPTVVRPSVAQQLLEDYECRSIQVSDFLPHMKGCLV